MSDWRDNLVTTTDGIAEVLASTRRIAVLGIKTEAQAGQPAFEVPRYMLEHGFDIVPVPVYFPEVTTILGLPVVRRLAEIETPVDMVNVFRRSGDVPPHVDDILASKPKSVWMQLGIANESAAESFARAGIKVVQNRCLMVDHARLAGRESSRQSTTATTSISTTRSGCARRRTSTVVLVGIAPKYSMRTSTCLKNSSMSVT